MLCYLELMWETSNQNICHVDLICSSTHTQLWRIGVSALSFNGWLGPKTFYFLKTVQLFSNDIHILELTWETSNHDICHVDLICASSATHRSFHPYTWQSVRSKKFLFLKTVQLFSNDIYQMLCQVRWGRKNKKSCYARC